MQRSQRPELGAAAASQFALPGQGRAISSWPTGVSQLRTWMMQMSTDAAGLGRAGFAGQARRGVLWPRSICRTRRTRCAPTPQT